MEDAFCDFNNITVLVYEAFTTLSYYLKGIFIYILLPSMFDKDELDKK